MTLWYMQMNKNGVEELKESMSFEASVTIYLQVTITLASELLYKKKGTNFITITNHQLLTINIIGP